MVIATAVKRRSARRLAGRKRPSYYESDSDNHTPDRDQTEYLAPSETPEHLAIRTRRSARQVAARERAEYAELSSEDDSPLESADEEAEFFELPPPKRQRRQRTTQPATRSAAGSRQPPGRPRRVGRSPAKKAVQKVDFRSTLGAPLKKRAAVASVGHEFCGPSDGNIPPWTTLPFEILRDTFHYAAQPLLERTITAQANVRWLIRAATTCRAFSVPALEAFYRAPALLGHHDPIRLRDMLDQPGEKKYINYAIKIKRLEVDFNCLVHTVAGKKLQLSDLVRLLPSLQHLHILHPMDEPPYRAPAFVRLQLLSTLFANLSDAMDEAGTQLKSWRWNRHLMHEFMLGPRLQTMAQIHRTKSFQSLQCLVVTNFSPTGSKSAPAVADLDQGEPHDFAVAISALPNLRDLTFISCDAVVDDFLLHIPNNLERLELSNCLEITSEMLTAYLASSGSNLRELELHHNAALNLSFLPGLKTFCPRLELMKMNLTCFSERENFNDAWIMYDDLLKPAERPTWPSTLRHLELIRLQKLSADAAVTLFSSLVESAEELPDLRHLTIQAQIDIPWRDRASFRDRWIDQLERVFLRRAKAPDPNYGSFKQIRIWKESYGAHVRGSTGVPGRYKLSHIAVTPQKKLPAEVIEPPAVGLRRSARVIETLSAAEDAATAAAASATHSEDEDEATSPEPEGFRQGLCNVVDIRIDNQRPRERQWTEGEFLDSEVSGDEDWHEGGDI